MTSTPTTKTIEITVTPEGATSIKTSGFTGSSCRDATRDLERALGLAGRESLLFSHSKPFRLPPGLDHVRHLPGLVFQFFEQLNVVGVTGPACEEQQVVGLVPPRLEPVGASRDRPIDQAFEPQEFVARKVHG